MPMPRSPALRLALAAGLSTTLAAALAAQAPAQFSDAVRSFIKIDAPVIALTNVRVIDGTGGPVRTSQTLVIRDGVIADVGDSAIVKAPANALTIDMTGKSVIPGLVMVHEHLYYPTGPETYGQLGDSFIRLY